MGFFAALTLVFVVLKLCGVIAWPWVWVASPMLLELAVFVVVSVLGAVFVVKVGGHKLPLWKRGRR